MDLFTARVQRTLSYLVVGGVFALVLLQGTGFVEIPEALLTKIMDAAFLVVLLYWFQRQRSEPTPPASTPSREGSRSA